MIHYVTGDATRPQGDGPKIIAHVCNDAGGWGAGFVVALSKRWKEPEAAYRRVAQWGLSLGATHDVRVGRDIVVSNMIAQHGYSTPGKPAIRYGALFTCLQTVEMRARTTDATVHMPRIGCGLAGGKWDVVEALIEEAMSDVEVFVYGLPGTA